MSHVPVGPVALVLVLLSPARQDKVLKGNQLTLVGEDKIRVRLTLDGSGGLVIQGKATTLKLDGPSCKLRLEHTASVKRKFDISLSQRGVVRMDIRSGKKTRFSVFGAALGSRLLLRGRGGSGVRIQNGMGSKVPLVSADETDMSRAFSLGSPAKGAQILMSLSGLHVEDFLKVSYFGNGIGQIATGIPKHGFCLWTTGPTGSNVMLGRLDWQKTLSLEVANGAPAKFQIR